MKPTPQKPPAGQKWALSPHHAAAYGAWAGSPQGHKPNPALCAESVVPSGRWPIPHQCRRARGYGPDGAFCLQHAPETVAAKKAAADAAFEAKLAKWRREDAGKAALGVLERIARGHNDPRALALAFLREHNVAPADLAGPADGNPPANKGDTP